LFIGTSSSREHHRHAKSLLLEEFRHDYPAAHAQPWKISGTGPLDITLDVAGSQEFKNMSTGGYNLLANPMDVPK
jgi:hypothetical protein